MRLDWAARVTIAAEVASALMHLHSLQPAGVMHGGLQPSCILLERDCSAQLGDAAIGTVLGLPQVLPSSRPAKILTNRRWHSLHI